MRHDAPDVGEDAIQHLIKVERAVERGGRIAQRFKQRPLLALGNFAALPGKRDAEHICGALDRFDFSRRPNAFVIAIIKADEAPPDAVAEDGREGQGATAFFL